MTALSEPGPDLARAADRLMAACLKAACIRVASDAPSTAAIDGLDAGVSALAQTYDRAVARPRRTKRSKP